MMVLLAFQHLIFSVLYHLKIKKWPTIPFSHIIEKYFLSLYMQQGHMGEGEVKICIMYSWHCISKQSTFIWIIFFTQHFKYLSLVRERRFFHCIKLKFISCFRNMSVIIELSSFLRFTKLVSIFISWVYWLQI